MAFRYDAPTHVSLPGASPISQPPQQFKELIAIVGLPRSGTTLATAIFDAHPRSVVCYEPWNRESGAGMTPEQTPQDLVARFKLKVAPGADIFVLKETTVDFKGIQWLTRFLSHNAKTHRVQIVWSLRAYRHTYLSFVEGARKWWGHKDMTPETEGYNLWVERGRRATRTLLGSYQKFPGAIYAYEALTAEPTTTLPCLMEALGLEFSDQQLDYLKHFSLKQVRGDVSMSENPRPISSDSVTKREAEWSKHEQELSEASGDILRKKLDLFWLQVYQQKVISGAISAELIPAELDPKTPSRPGHEYREKFSSRAEWQEFVCCNPAIQEERLIDTHAAAIVRNGFKFRGEAIHPSKLDRVSGNYRESFTYKGLNSRKRAILIELFGDLRPRALSKSDARIFTPEAQGGFTTFLTEEFLKFQGSGYAPDLLQPHKLEPNKHQNLAELGYPDATFDYALVNDMFEHEENIDATLGEIHRVLAPGGVLLSTFQFAGGSDEHLVQTPAKADNGTGGLGERDEKDSPVFQVLGWNILKECHSLGFASADMIFLVSPTRGILASGISGVMLLKAVKPA
jgi:SAM-dependent methyltransferase